MKINPLFGLASWFALGLSACSADDGPLRDADTNTRDTDTEASLIELDWRPCGDSIGRDVTCAELSVPVDHDAPDGDKLQIALNRIAANPLELRRGVLVFNPGGPGASGKQIVRALHEAEYFDAVAPGFDIVGFDPRGVGESGERSCGLEPDLMMGEMTSSAASPMGAFVADVANDGQRCERTWGPLLRHLGSNQVVRDMDLLREALGEEKLNFLGASYGTRLGALYAHTFPRTTGAIVLDAPVSQVDMLAKVRASFTELVALHEALFTDCSAGRLVCPPEPRLLFDEVMAAAAELEIDAEIAYAWADMLSDEVGRQYAVRLLEIQAAGTNTDVLLEVAASTNEPGVNIVANLSVNCTDSTRDPASIDELDALLNELYEASPLFAFEAFPAASCSGWPTTRDPVPVPSAYDAPPLLVIGGTRDRRTPYHFAEEMTEALGNAVLLTSNHYGHVATTSSGACTRDAVRAYLVDSALPEYGAVCP